MMMRNLLNDSYILKYFGLPLFLLSTIIFAIIGLTANAYAADFSLGYASIIDSISDNESAEYLFNITNMQTIQERFQIYTISASWDLTPSLVIVEPNSAVKFTLEIMPIDTKLFGPQLVPVTIKALSDQTLSQQNLYVYIKPTNSTVKSYVPNVAMEVKIKDEIDPRESLSIEVYMRNRNPLNIKDLRIDVSSSLFSREYKTTLGPLEEKTNQVLFADIDPIQEPGTYTVTVKLIYDNKTLGEVKKDILIKSYSDLSLQHTQSRTLFSLTDTFTLKNNGNSELVKLVKLEKGFFARIFTHTSAKYVLLKEEGKNYISWDVPLEPEQQIKITVTTNYIILFIIAVLLVCLIISYYIVRSPILLFKRAKIVLSSDHGVSEIKVKLHIKNRSRKVIRNIKLIDKYPKITRVEEDSSLGVFRPSKMLTADKNNSMLMWELEILEPYEERLVTYKLVSHLNIIGDIHLPPAKIKFHTKAGERSYISNAVILMHKSSKSMDRNDTSLDKD
jgi:hypothetical protein